METLRWFQLLSPWMKSYGVTIQMKPRQHYFHRIKLIFKTDSAQRSSNKCKKYLLNTHSTATFSMLFETSHFLVPYLFTYKTHHFLRENILVRSKSAQNSGCVL